MAFSDIDSSSEWQNASESLKRTAYIFAKAKLRYFESCKTAWEAREHLKDVRAQLSELPFSLNLPCGIGWLLNTVCGVNAYRYAAERHFDQAKRERENALQCLLELEENLEKTVKTICECRSAVQMRRLVRGFCTDTSPMQSLRACITEAEMALRNRVGASKRTVTVYWQIPVKQLDEAESGSAVGDAAPKVASTEVTGKRRRSEVDVAGESAESTGDADAGPDADPNSKRRKMCPISGNVAVSDNSANSGDVADKLS